MINIKCIITRVKIDLKVFSDFNNAFIFFKKKKISSKITLKKNQEKIKISINQI